MKAFVSFGKLIFSIALFALLLFNSWNKHLIYLFDDKYDYRYGLIDSIEENLEYRKLYSRTSFKPHPLVDVPFYQLLITLNNSKDVYVYESRYKISFEKARNVLHAGDYVQLEISRPHNKVMKIRDRNGRDILVEQFSIGDYRVVIFLLCAANVILGFLVIKSFSDFIKIVSGRSIFKREEKSRPKN